MTNRLLVGAGSLLLAAFAVVPTMAQYGYHFGRNKIQYEDFDWHILRTDHFDIFYYPEMQTLAEHGAHFAEEAYEELQNRFNFSLTGRVPIIFYSSNIHFKQTNTTPGFIPDGVGGFFEFLKGRVVIPANGDIHRFRRVIRHELVHVFTYSLVLRTFRDHRMPPDRFLPLWFTEGIAEYWSGDADYQHEMILRDALFSNYLVPLENMYRIYGTYLMYKQGEAICRFIAETYGPEKLLQLMEESWKDRDFRVVMELTLREDFHAISAAWDDWLKEQYYPALEDAQLATLVADPIASRGANMKPVYYRKRDGTRMLYYLANRTGYTNVYAVELDSLYQPKAEAEILVRGERNDRFEAFHLFESRMGVSDDGKLAFVTKSGEKDVIHVYDLEQDELGPTYGFENLIAVYSPDWRPDGTKLTFSSIDRSGFSDLFVYDPEAHALHKLTDDSYDDRDPSWSPDGRYIAFSSDRTSWGDEFAYNLFTYDLEERDIQYVTFGDQHDFSPRWSPDGRYLAYTSTQKDSTGRYGAQNIWVADMRPATIAQELASADPEAVPPARAPETRTVKRLTDITAAAYDPVWAGDEGLVFTSFEHYRFTVRKLADVDSLIATPREVERERLSDAGEHWAFARIGVGAGEAERVRYRKKYQLDIAQGGVTNNAIWGTTGGAMMAFSDLMGDDYWYVALYNSARGSQEVLKSINFAVTRVQLHRRTNIAYGVYRYGGLRYDITDPDASATYPVFWETMYGGTGGVSYPLSMFRRIELNTSFGYSSKEIRQGGGRTRDALLLSNAVSLVHDNTLYGMNGPRDGWRANLTLGYTTDLLYSNVSYYTLSADVRHYLNIGGVLTLASWGMGKINSGREARLFILGGSWDLRGHRFLSIRGTKMWFTSHELRFPILQAPSLYVPLLAPFGIANLRGAFFLDAAHVWNDGYYDQRPMPLANIDPITGTNLSTGQTLGAAGLGFRMNLFGGFVLRYDLGYRYSDGFKNRSDLFKQFFFGWDF